MLMQVENIIRRPPNESVFNIFLSASVSLEISHSYYLNIKK